jgi:hypothetical protein
MIEPCDGERVINVADIDPQYRRAILSRLFEHLRSPTLNRTGSR